MADGFEFFSPSEGGESYDPAAFERFKDQVKANAQFIAAQRKGEQKQKQKEDRLAKILLQMIQRNQKSGILMLAAKLLAENIPASFILAIIVLGNYDIQKEVEQELAMLSAPEQGTENQTASSAKTSEFSLITQFSDPTLPLALKAEIDSWGKGIFEAGSATPFRILETALNKEGNIKNVVIDCGANVLGDFLVQSKAPVPAYESIYSFCEFFMKGVMKRLKEQVENQQQLK